MLSRGNCWQTQRPTSVDHNRSLSLPQQPSPNQTIVNLLEEHGLSVVPFLYAFSRDRLPWMTLNGPEPLLDVVPPVETRVNSPQTGGWFEWEWSIFVILGHLGGRTFLSRIIGYVKVSRDGFSAFRRPHISSYRPISGT
jgi:hypothetical protein